MENQSNSAEIAVRQENELEALQAIYCDSVVDLRQNDTWKVKRPPEMLINLCPQGSMTMKECYALIDLYIKCPLEYPEIIPEIGLKNAQGLSNQKIQQLHDQLIDLAKKHIGIEMIFDLCSHVQSFLHDNNRPPPPSFYDDMINNHKRLQEQRKLEDERQKTLKQMQEQQQLRELEEEVQRIEQSRKEDARKRRELAKQLGNERSSGDNNLISSENIKLEHSRMSASPKTTDPGNQSGRLQKRSMSVTVFDQREPATKTENLNKVPLEKTITIKFRSDSQRTIHRGKCLGTSVCGSRVFVGMDAETGELVAVTQWELHWSPANKQTSTSGSKENPLCNKYKSQIESIENELLQLLHLSHNNLVLYLGISHQTEPHGIKIHILAEYVGGGNLQSSVRSHSPVPLDRLRNYTHQTLDGLAYLHSKGIVHRDLRLSSLHLDSSTRIRIADYSINKKLVDLVQDGSKFKNMIEKKGENQTKTTMQCTKQDDIYRLGLIVLSLAFGYNVTKIPTELPSNLSAEFLDFFNHCIEMDDSLCLSANKLMEHPFIRTPLYSELSLGGGSFRNYATVMSKSQVCVKPSVCDDDDDDDNDEDVDNRLIQSISSGSRLKTEFKILQIIGKGAFGDVVKVRNLLDNRCYAIKRIPLNPLKRKQYKKITREVEVLSRLNHENIVRYYNSWLERSEQVAFINTDNSHMNADRETDQFPFDSSIESIVERKIKPRLASTSGDNPVTTSNDGMRTISSSVARSSSSEEESSSESEDDDDDDVEESSSDADADVFGPSQWMMSSSESEDGDDAIVFKDDSQTTVKEEANNEIAASNCFEKNLISKKRKPKKQHNNLQYLFIQMEFCEKSTLRDCIDQQELYKDVNRVWQLFREIVEGLAHIHDQGIIHRDLKPVNIFLDSENHVKIGDFGLATAFMDIIAEPAGAYEMSSKETDISDNHGDHDVSLTGKVGTFLYVSPEMDSNSNSYNLKVDIYSLGIIFFEMCYRPLPPGMERAKVLTNVRKTSVEFPSDFNEICRPNQGFIINWLLSHDPQKRPTSKELRRSTYVPLSQVEESEIYEVFHLTTSNPESRSYKLMTDMIFSQKVLPATDFSYDGDLFKSSLSLRQVLIQESITNTLSKIFHRHGAVRLVVPLLMPASSLYDGNDAYVSMMDRSGGLVSLPYDSMVPFARFVARGKSSNFKRFSFDRVFRDCRPSKVHPRELWAASFDIVKSVMTGVIDDSEVIFVIYEIIHEFPVLKARNYRLRISHKSLLVAILLHCGVPEETHRDVFAILGDNSVDRHQKLQKQARLCSLPLSEVCVESIFSFIQKEDTVANISSFLRCITKTKTQAASLVKKGLHEIEAVIDYLTALHCGMEVVLCLGFVSNIQLYSGIFFQIIYKEKRKEKVTWDILATGGRYDELVATFRKPTEKDSGCPHAVGVSIAFDKIVIAAMDDNSIPRHPLIELFICSMGCKSLIKEQLSTAQKFWEIGISVEINQADSLNGLENIKDHCRNNNIPYLLVFKDADVTLYKFQVAEKDRVIKKEAQINDILDYFQKFQTAKVVTKMVNDREIQDPIKSQQFMTLPTDPGLNNPLLGGGTSICGVSGGGVGGNIQVPSFMITFVLMDTTKLVRNTKRNYETQIANGISETLLYLCARNRVEVLGTELPGNVLKAIAAHFEMNKDDRNIMTNIIGVKEGQRGSNKKYITKVVAEIKDLKTKHKNSPIVLYGLNEDIHKVIL